MPNPYYSGPVSDHFDGTRFFIADHARPLGLGAVLKWRFNNQKQPWPKATSPLFSDSPPSRIAGAGLRVSYIGHASFLIQTQGLNILIDPVWSQRASPSQFFGPKRVNPPGIALEDLPPIDVVLVSHNHYDHLDLATLRALHIAHRPRIITPLGNDTIIRRAHADMRIETFDWHDHIRLGPDLVVHCEPANHWSARSINDRFMALWCAFTLASSSGNIYHIADTGYGSGEIFAAAKAKHGSFRLAILPIGAYEPRWFMRGQHINPEEAVKILTTLDAPQAIAHHWGTFQLTDEALEAPLAALADALAARAIPASRFATPRPGQAITLG